MTLHNDVTRDEAAGWWNASDKTVEDLRDTGNRAILRHILVAELAQHPGC